ncbi:hypothetical protein I5U77_11420, partial [Stenotrophomonas maltophilia]|nr:hypothetical protein [Stenotrophomonas maltophilia]
EQQRKHRHSDAQHCRHPLLLPAEIQQQRCQRRAPGAPPPPGGGGGGGGAAARQIQGNHQQKTGDRVVERRCERVYR